MLLLSATEGDERTVVRDPVTGRPITSIEPEFFGDMNLVP
jgi:hypothetical protein